MSFLNLYLRYSESNVTLTFFADFPFESDFGFRFGEGLRFGDRRFGIRLVLEDVRELDFKGFIALTFFPLCFFRECFFRDAIFLNNESHT